MTLLFPIKPVRRGRAPYLPNVRDRCRTQDSGGVTELDVTDRTHDSGTPFATMPFEDSVCLALVVIDDNAQSLLCRFSEGAQVSRRPMRVERNVSVVKAIEVAPYPR